MTKQEIIFDSSEPKKHSVCFKTSQKDPAISSVYLMRTAFAGQKEPKKIKVTVEEVE